MYSVEVRNSIMIAHSLPHPFFGPAQGKHGATYVVDVAFMRAELDAHNVVVDIGAAGDALAAVLKELNYQDLDTLPQFKGKLTTTEFLARHIFDMLRAAILKGRLGADAQGLAHLRVRLGETHLASAAYEAPLNLAGTATS